MIEVKGNCNTALCFCASLEERAEAQIRAVCDREEFSESRIRIMPDVHAGMGCTIGTTMTIKDKVVPGMVGVDIGCGMETAELGAKEIDFNELDALIRREIPSGRDVRESRHTYNNEIDLNELCCLGHVNIERARLSIGTLGGGNHFIEIDRDDDGRLYLVVHSGSRHIGNEVAMYYQEEAYRSLCGNSKRQITELIARLKAEGGEKEIFSAVAAAKENSRTAKDIPKELSYVSGELFDDYIHDMKLIQYFAMLNRRAMTEIILEGMRLKARDRFTTIHNYIDTDAMILRKGAVSARSGERLLIPINMRDGSLICVGKGNPDWNFSAPHGAGRLMSRKEAFGRLSMEEYEREMQGIFSTCINRRTLDEAPMAYRGMDEMLSQIGPTASAERIIRPLYNFKAAE